VAKILRAMLTVTLTGAVLTAIVVRLRRRASMPGAGPSMPPPEPAERRASLWLPAILVVAALVITLAVVFTPSASRGERSVPTPAPISAPSPTPMATLTPMAPVPSARACTRQRQPIVVRTVDPLVRQAVNRQWRRIERWLRANAPRTYAALGAPGRTRTVAIAEAQIGMAFPEDLHASLLRHNGGLGFLGIRQIRDTWRRACAQGQNLAIPVMARGAVVHRLDPADQGAHLRLLRSYASALEASEPVGGLRPVVRRGLLEWEEVA
jgi:hypothetical protein